MPTRSARPSPNFPHEKGRTAKDADAFYYLGATLAKLGRHSEAAAALEQASRLDPKNAETLASLGGEYTAAGDADHAIDAYRRAGAVNPDEFYVYKRTLAQGRPAILRKSLGTKAIKMIFGEQQRAEASRSRE